MTDDLATANSSRTGPSLTTASPRCAAFRGPGPGLILFVLLFLTVGARTLVAHDVIDIEQANALVSATDEDVAIMAAGSAEALFLGKPPFDDIHDAPLRIIVSFGSHTLVCRASFMARHAYLIARTLAEHKDAFPVPAGAPDGVVPMHRGSRAFFAGQELPDD